MQNRKISLLNLSVPPSLRIKAIRECTREIVQEYLQECVVQGRLPPTNHTNLSSNQLINKINPTNNNNPTNSNSPTAVETNNINNTNTNHGNSHNNGSGNNIKLNPRISLRLHSCRALQWFLVEKLHHLLPLGIQEVYHYLSGHPRNPNNISTATPLVSIKKNSISLGIINLPPLLIPSDQPKLPIIIDEEASEEGIYLLTALDYLFRKEPESLHNENQSFEGMAVLLVTIISELLTHSMDLMFHSTAPQLHSSNIPQSSNSPSISQKSQQFLLNLLKINSTIQFAPLNSLFSLWNVPSWIAEIFKTQTINFGLPNDHSPSNSFGGSGLTWSSGVNPTHIDIRALFCTVCYQILSMLESLFQHTHYFKELLQYDKLASLLEILSYDLRSVDVGLYLVQRQLTRCLTRMLQSACSSRDLVLALRDRKVVATLLSVLRQSTWFPSTIRLELCQLIIFLVVKSVQISSLLLDQFEQEGYSVIHENLLYIGKFGTTQEKLALIESICYLTTVNSSKLPQTALADLPNLNTDKLGVKNIEGMHLLLASFTETNSSELRTYILRTLSALFSHNFYTYSVIQHLKPFCVLFAQFEKMDTSNRNLCLNMMNSVRQCTSLLDEEMKLYCTLLTGKRPSGVLLICRHMTTSIEDGQLSCNPLNNAGLLSLIIQSLGSPLIGNTNSPNHAFAYLQSSVNKLPVMNSWTNVFSTALSDPEELRLSLSLLSEEESLPLRTNSVNSGLDILAVLYAISLRLLNLLLVFLVKSKEVFRDGGGLQKLESLLHDLYLRQAALKVIAVVAYDAAMSFRVVSDLIGVLETSGGAATIDKDVLSMRKDILFTLCHIFQRHSASQNAFRTAGGFVWVSSVVDGIGKCIDKEDRSGEAYERTFQFIKVVIRMLSLCLKNNPENRDYFKQEIQGFVTLEETLSKAGFIEEDTACMPIVTALLDLGTRSDWPPTCPRHPANSIPLIHSSLSFPSFSPLSSSPAYSPTVSPSLLSPAISPHASISSYSSSTSLNDLSPLLTDAALSFKTKNSKQESLPCSSCKDACFLEFPEFIGQVSKEWKDKI